MGQIGNKTDSRFGPFRKIQIKERFARAEPSKDPLIGLHPDIIFTDLHLDGTILYEGVKYYKNRKDESK